MQGLHTKSEDKPTNEEFIKEISNIDIVGIVETHLVEGQSSVRAIEGFDTKYFNRPKHNKARHGSGGIAILAKPHLTEGLKYFPSKNNDYVWIKMEKSFFN